MGPGVLGALASYASHFESENFFWWLLRLWTTHWCKKILVANFFPDGPHNALTIFIHLQHMSNHITAPTIKVHDHRSVGFSVTAERNRQTTYLYVVTLFQQSVLPRATTRGAVLVPCVPENCPTLSHYTQHSLPSSNLRLYRLIIAAQPH